MSILHLHKALDDRARVFEGGFIRPYTERRAVARQSVGLIAALVILGGFVVVLAPWVRGWL